MKSQKSQVGSINDLNALVDEYLAKGNKITQCPPGPSEEVVYKNQYRKRPKKPDAAAAPAEAPADASPDKTDAPAASE
ncbi:hypothetical protein [Skermanella pratensis]|uniref:hypothetical protein n=1 Tax=Skermanella pratensis TaxID=2233999 RepID=UPI001301230C|nr:hypothetical protein [Skermanella pratensis]